MYAADHAKSSCRSAGSCRIFKGSGLRCLGTTPLARSSAEPPMKVKDEFPAQRRYGGSSQGKPVLLMCDNQRCLHLCTYFQFHAFWPWCPVASQKRGQLPPESATELWSSNSTCRVRYRKRELLHALAGVCERSAYPSRRNLYSKSHRSFLQH